MRVCSLCHRCYDDSVVSCTEESHPPLSKTHNGSPEMIAGYRLEFLFESGIKGEVYRARQTASGQPCLLRIPATEAQNSQRFLDEAKLAAALFHPNVVDVYEAGFLDSGECFVVSEDPDGETLRDVLDNVGVPELLTSIQIVRQTAEALHAIHLKGLTHRAVRPENIILTTDHEDRLLVRIKDPDFGGVIAQSIVSNKFLIDSAIDSLKYFAPEQCSNEAVSIKTDVYGLGVVFYEMLAGAPPFDASKAAGLIEMHRNQRPPEVKIDDFDLRMLVTHALMESLIKQPAKRQASANVFARQLRHIEQLATHVSTPPPAGAVPPAPPKAAAATSPIRPSIIQPAAVIETPKAIYKENAQPVAAAIEHEPVSELMVESDSLVTAFKVESEPIPVIDMERSADDLPEIPTLVFEEPVTESFANERSASSMPRPSRMKIRRKKLHPKTAPPAPELPDINPLPTAEPIHVMPLKVQAVPGEIAAIRAEPAITAAVPLGPKPAKIEWDQPDDDIPSVADVLDVLSNEPLIEISSKPELITAAHAEPESIAVVPIEPKPAPKKTLVVHAEPKAITVPPKPRTKPKAAPKEIPIAREPGEIAVVSARPKPIRIEREQPRALPKRALARAGLPHATSEVVFFPTLLGGVEKRKTVDGESMLSAYYPSLLGGSSVSSRSLMIAGGGFAALIVLFLIGNAVVGRFASGEGPSAPVAAKTITTQESLPQAGQTEVKKTALKNFRQSLPEDNVVHSDRTTSLPTKERLPRSAEISPTTAVKAGDRNQAPKTATVSRNAEKTRDNGNTKTYIQPAKSPADKKPLTVPNKAAGATRPRIVKDPKP